MVKRVIDVGNCDPDHHSIKSMLTSRFDVTVERVHTGADAIARLKEKSADLVLVNRKLDIDYSDGIEIIRQIKSIPDLSATPVMLVTNYEDHQREAVAVGAEYGFGKLQLNDPATHQRLSLILDEAS